MPPWPSGRYLLCGACLDGADGLGFRAETALSGITELPEAPSTKYTVRATTSLTA